MEERGGDLVTHSHCGELHFPQDYADHFGGDGDVAHLFSQYTVLILRLQTVCMEICAEQERLVQATTTAARCRPPFEEEEEEEEEHGRTF